VAQVEHPAHRALFLADQVREFGDRAAVFPE
jgi:hypothetical protein